MKLTLSNIRKIKSSTDNKLIRHICDYVIDKWNCYTDKENIFNDVLYNGCRTGIVSELAYYSGSRAFYEKYRIEINDLLSGIMRSTGRYSLSEIFGDEFDAEDPLIMGTNNKNLLAWFGFEETLHNVGFEFDRVQHYI